MKKVLKTISALVMAVSIVLPSVVISPLAAGTAELKHVYITTDTGNVESTLTVNCTYDGDESDLTYQWYSNIQSTYQREDGGNGVKIAGATDKSYQLTGNELGKYMYCLVTPKGGNAVLSMPYGMVKESKTDETPTVDQDTMHIWADNGQIGDTLYAHYSYQSIAGIPEGNSEIVWQSSDAYNGTYTDIAGAERGNTYILRPEDYGRFIRFKVIPRDEKGNAGSHTLFRTGAVYCTPGNLMLGAVRPAVKNDGEYGTSLMTAHTAVSDYIISRPENVYYGNNMDKDITYTVDIRKEISFDKLLFVGRNGNFKSMSKVEISDDGKAFATIWNENQAAESSGVCIILLDQLYTARYVKFTYVSGSYPYTCDVQAFLQPETVSEIFGITLEGAVLDREEKTITEIPDGTTSAELIAALQSSDMMPDMKIYDYNDEEIAPESAVLSGYKLVSFSQNRRTVTEYLLSNTESMPAIVVKNINIPVDSKGLRVDREIEGMYELMGITDTPDDDRTEFQWYFSQAADGEYTAILGAADKTYTPDEEKLNGYLKFEVLPANGLARISSAAGPVKTAISDIPAAPTCEAVTIRAEAGVVYANDILTGEYAYFDANADDEVKEKTEKQWFRSDSGDKYTPIANAVSDTYTLTEEDVEKYVVYGVKPYAETAPYQGEDFCYSEKLFVTKEPAEADCEKLSLKTGSQVTSNLVLPLKGENGSDITWKSDNPSVIGTDGVVKRQSSDQYVTLTAEIKHKDRELVKYKEFKDIFVPKKNTSSGGSSGGGGGSSDGGRNTIMPPVTKPPVVITDLPDNQEQDKKLELVDMNESDWAYPYVKDLIGKGVLAKPEDGRFNPKSELKREEGIKMLIELFDLLNENSACDFADVSEEHWAYKYVASAKENGLTNGIGDNMFGVGMSVTRQDFTVMAYNFLKKKGIEKNPVKESVSFADEENISAYAKEAIDCLAKANVISGTPEGNFLPNNSITREEAAKIICSLSEN